MVRRTAILSIGLKLAFDTPYGPFSLKLSQRKFNEFAIHKDLLFRAGQLQSEVGVSSLLFGMPISLAARPLLGFSAPVVGNDIDSFPLQPPPFPRNLLCPLPVNVHIWMLEDNGAVSIVDSISRCSRSE